ncbi:MULTISPECIES: PEGA domain-containing protein [unclassified Corallococcus]|uniref:PEGA domain-containing protein n=1 Tax=unclassified Corallococcus TaxID=2685029 RepID=UPI001A8E2DBA|nr:MULTISPECIES: PEGA domain-containing protein [unclassified Corallococcus]MBN9683197.1 PEGA domain-containing protein [Corallococcus sp. NCSPR001]WAS85277.1 PEGA domain-containing protein [Corallococcus sp. NCRR]
MRRPFNRALHATLSGWLVGMLAVGPAAAQQQHVPLRLVPRTLPAAAGPRVAVVAIPVDASLEGEALALTHWAEQAVARSGRLELVRLTDALDAQGAAARQAKAVEGNAAFKDGAKAYDELDTVKALQSFDKAVKSYEQADLSRAFPLLSRARVMKAATQVANGENKAAELEMRGVLAVDPRATFNPNFFPPEQVAFVEKERKAQLDGAQAALHVTTQPAAQVFVDGTYRGVSPLALTGLTRADHYVTLLAPGYAVTEGRAREGESSFTLTKLPVQQRYAALVERIAKNPDDEERDQALQELGVLAGVPQVLALLVRGGPGNAPLTVTGLRMDVADGHNVAYALGQVPRGDAMATGSEALLTGLVAQDASRVDGKPVKHFAGGGGVSRKTAGYVLLATGVALLAGGIYFGLEASSKADAFKTAPQGSSRAEDLKSTGKTYALVADIGVLAGLVSAGAGSYLAFYKKGGGSSSSAPASPPAEKAAPAREEKPMKEALPMPPPPPAAKTEPAPKANATSTPATEPAPEKAPPPPVFEPPPTPPPAKKMTRKEREAEARRQREEEARLKREEEQRKKEEEAQRKKDEEAKRKADEEAKRKAEEEARRKREEEKKRPKLDEDDLRNY